MPGAVGNLPAGSITMMPVQIAGIVKVTNPAPTAEGYDAETDQAYYDRFILNLQTPPTSGNQYHYRSWALEVSGVGGVQVYPLGHGANTVDVVIIDTEGKPASEPLVQACLLYTSPAGTDGVLRRAGRAAGCAGGRHTGGAGLSAGGAGIVLRRTGGTAAGGGGADADGRRAAWRIESSTPF